MDNEYLDFKKQDLKKEILFEVERRIKSDFSIKDKTGSNYCITERSQLNKRPMHVIHIKGHRVEVIHRRNKCSV